MVDEKGALIPDFIGRFENLNKDFSKVCDMIGIPKMDLPTTNISRHQHYRHYYNTDTRNIVAELYKEDIDRFCYSF